MIANNPKGRIGVTGYPWYFADAFVLDSSNKKMCSFCKDSFADIAARARMGCAECYKVFREEIAPMIKSLHGHLSINSDDQHQFYKIKSSNQYSDIIISSRIRFARNIQGIKFAPKNEQAFDNIMNSLSNNFKFKKIKDFSEKQINELVKKRIISKQLSNNKTSGHLAIVHQNTKLVTSINIGEEDHIRIQSICNGLDLDTAYEQAKKIDTAIKEKCKFAFDSKLGYLTECLTNIGTGMRASVMLHLPELSKNGMMTFFVNQLRDLHIDVRGGDGEESEANNNLYQVSNNISMGRSEKESKYLVFNIATMLADYELSYSR